MIQAISSGTPIYSDPNALRATTVTINGSASVKFVAGNCRQRLIDNEARCGDTHSHRGS